MIQIFVRAPLRFLGAAIYSRLQKVGVEPPGLVFLLLQALGLGGQSYFNFLASTVVQLPYTPTPPNVPPLRAIRSLLDGIWGLLKGSWGVLADLKLLAGDFGRDAFRPSDERRRQDLAAEATCDDRATAMDKPKSNCQYHLELTCQADESMMLQ